MCQRVRNEPFFSRVNLIKVQKGKFMVMRMKSSFIERSRSSAPVNRLMAGPLQTIYLAFTIRSSPFARAWACTWNRSSWLIHTSNHIITIKSPSAQLNTPIWSLISLRTKLLRPRMKHSFIKARFQFRNEKIDCNWNATMIGLQKSVRGVNCNYCGKERKI